MLRRELALVLRARVTWFSGAAAALLVGHGFVLAIDLFTAGSRSVAASALMSREFDPLLGVVRPTLGGLYLALSLFGPLLGARCLAVEKDRRTFHTLVLATGSVPRLVARKWLSGCAGVLLPWAAAVGLLLLWRALGGHLQVRETIAALTGYLLYGLFATSLGVAAAAFTRGFAQAATTALLAVALTWAIDASEGFSALAWLGGAAAWSPTTYLRAFEQGIFDIGACGWFCGATIGTLVLACVGCRFDLRGGRRGIAVGLGVVVLIVASASMRAVPGAWDLTESARRSLPPAAAAELRQLPGTMEIVANLDREDSRRRQLESDLLAKLRLARPDLRVRWPPDERNAPGAFSQDEAYGRIVIRLGERSLETTSTSRRELTTLIFQLAGKALPDWSQPEYPGYPLVVEGRSRQLVLVACYLVLPLTFVVLGLLLTSTRRKTR